MHFTICVFAIHTYVTMCVLYVVSIIPTTYICVYCISDAHNDILTYVHLYLHIVYTTDCNSLLIVPTVLPLVKTPPCCVYPVTKVLCTSLH